MRLQSPLSANSASTMKGFQDVFISYGRTDSKAFAAKLNNRLIAEGLEVWFDCEDIPLGVDFQTQIEDGIEKAHNFLFIISPHAVNSAYCIKEIELAVKYNKRIIPVMHVEAIDYQTWNARNPGDSLDHWAIYKAQGKHSSFPNMHPEICKINWAYCREGVDDFEKFIAGLLEIFDRQKTYVYQHTCLLARALDWERNQKQSRYLLTGQTRVKAEQWLKIFFKHEQPPCVPTDLHCEFIIESVKNANNLMTQVFLSYAESDHAIAERIRKTLMRESFTVWTSKTDVQTGEASKEEIKKGIEGADTFVYLLSHKSLNSKSCQQALDHAFIHNKRIIPLQIESIDIKYTLSKRSRSGLDQIFSKLEGSEANPILSKLQTIPLIEFSQYEDKTTYRAGIDKLLQQLKQDAPYYEQHKILLVKSLKWREQGHNPSILLRGYSLEQAQAWLKVARSRSDHPPIEGQEKFIAASLNQPPESSIDVFICYSSVDADFARQINEALQLQGKTTWFDQENIAAGTNFLQETYRGIEVSDNVLFILSPDAVNSSYCTDEFIFSQALNKRLVTILHRPVDLAEWPLELAKVQWIDFRRRQGDFYANFSELVRALDVDREYVRGHNKWVQRAMEWQKHDHSEDLLLRGSELTLAESWLQEAEQQRKHPPVTTQQKAFIEASRELRDRLLRDQEEHRFRELRRIQKIAIASMATGITLAGLTLFSGIQLRAAEIEKIQALRASSEANFALGQELDALKESLRAGKTLRRSWLQAVWPQPELRNQVIGSMHKIIYAVRERDRFVVQGTSRISPNGEYLAASDAKGVIRLWNISEHQFIQWLGHPGLIINIRFSPDSQLLATSGQDGAVRLWNRQGQLVKEIVGPSDQPNIVQFDPEGKRLVTAGGDGVVRLWDLQAQLLKEFVAHQDRVDDISFSPDGLQLATIAWDTVRLWDVQGQQITQLPGHADRVTQLEFHPNGQQIATSDNQGQVFLWDVQGRLIQALNGHQDRVSHITFSPDGQRLAAASWEGSVFLWDLQAEQRTVFRGHHNPIYSISFSPDGRQLLTGEGNGSVRLWNLQGEEIAVLRAHQDVVHSLSFIPNSQQLITASWDGTLRLWDLQGKHLKALSSHHGAVSSVRFSPDGQQLMTVSALDGSARLWNRQGQLIIELQDQPGHILEAGFSPNGQVLFTRTENSIGLWNSQGQPIAKMRHADQIWGVWLSPDSQYLATTDEGGAVRLWNLQGQSVTVLQGLQGNVLWVNFSPDGEQLAAAGEDGRVRLWTIQGKLLTELQGHQGGVYRVRFSPNGQQILTAAWDGSVRLWDRQGQLLSQLDDLSGEVRSIHFNRQGPILLISQLDGSLHLQDLQGRRLTELGRHQRELKTVKFSLDHQRLLTVASDGAARLWNLSGEQLAEFGGYDHDVADMGQVLDISLSPDGKLLATAGEDGLVKLWRVETLNSLMARGCNWLKGYLTGLAQVDRRPARRQDSLDPKLCRGV